MSKQNESVVPEGYYGEGIPEGYFGSEKKWEIVKAAAEIFIKKGTVNTGVREIAEAGGITVGTLYHYFKSKEEIISAFMDFAVSGTDAFLQANRTMLLKIEPREALRRAIKMYVDFTNEAQNIVLFWHQETRNLSPELRKRLLDNEYVLTNVFEEIIRRGNEEGVFRVGNTWLAAHNVIIMCDMWAFRRWALGRRMTADQFKHEQVEFIFEGLGAQHRIDEPKHKEVEKGNKRANSS